MVIELNGKRVHCPKCGGDDVVKHGTKVTQSKGRRQRYFCNNKGHTFYYEGEK